MQIRTLVETYLNDPRFVQNDAGHPLFPIADWQYEVDCNTTRRGYQDWLASQIEQECDAAENAFERLLHGAPRAFFHDQTETGFAKVVEDCFAQFRAMDTEALAKAWSILGTDREEEGGLLKGETFRILPGPVLDALERIAHLGMEAYAGRADQDKIDLAIHDLGAQFDLESEEIEMARARQGIEVSCPQP